MKSPFQMFLLSTAMAAFLLTSCSVLFAETKEWKTERKLDQQLSQGVSLLCSESPFRPFLQSLMDKNEIGMLLDRRVNPSQKTALNLKNITLKGGIDQLAKRGKAETTRVGNVIYIGPSVAAKSIRTVIALREEEFQKIKMQPSRQRLQLTKKTNVSWNDLDSPREIIQQLEKQVGIAIKRQETIPHDLLAKATLPDVTFIEATSLVLIQYDLTFQWTDQGMGIEIVPLPQKIVMTKLVPLKKNSYREAVEKVRKTFPRVSIKKAKLRKIRVTARIEDLEAIDALLSGREIKKGTNTKKYVPLANRRFDLRVADQTAANLLKSLVNAGIELDYDEEKLRKQSISLDQKLKFELKNATIEELLDSICRPVGAKYEIDGEVIRLTPRK